MFYPILSVAIVSLISLIGVFTISLKTELLKKYVFILVSLSVGALLGDAFLHLIPESFESSLSSTTVSILIISGIILFFITEKIIHWHHHLDDCDGPHPVGKLITISDGIHNLVDGLIIGSSFMVSTEVGIATSIAVILHEIPQEIGDFGVLLQAGYTKSRAIFLNFLSGLTAFLGLIISFVLQDFSSQIESYIIPIAAGSFIYIALSDLIPELHKTKNTKRSVIEFAFILVGLFLMLSLLIIE